MYVCFKTHSDGNGSLFLHSKCMESFKGSRTMWCGPDHPTSLVPCFTAQTFSKSLSIVTHCDMNLASSTKSNQIYSGLSHLPLKMTVPEEWLSGE